jgi:DNA-binding protein YbaB
MVDPVDYIDGSGCWPAGGGQVDRPDWSIVRSMIDDLHRARNNLATSQQKILKIKGEAWSEDRLVKVVVGPRGQLIDLEIDPRVFRNPNSKALANTILATVRAAVDDAQRQSREVRDDLIPKDLRALADGRPGNPDLLTLHDADLEDSGA